MRRYFMYNACFPIRKSIKKTIKKMAKDSKVYPIITETKSNLFKTHYKLQVIGNKDTIDNFFKELNKMIKDGFKIYKKDPTKKEIEENRV